MSKRYFYNGQIRTLDAAAPVVGSIFITEEKIKAIGKEADALAAADPQAQRIDLNGKCMLPAFSDSHIHIWKVGDLLTGMLDLRGVSSKEMMLERLSEFAARNPGNPWILARGFNEASFADNTIPDRYDLDRAVTERPVQVIRTCAHIAVLNSKALEICGIDAQTRVPEGGEIRVDAKGQISGILTETALGLVKKHIPPYSAAAYRRMIEAAQEELLSVGVASATDPAVHPELLEVYRQMEREGALKIRIQAVPIRIPDGATEALLLPERYESKFLSVDTVKFFADGGLSGKTAALYHPYKDSRENGMLRLDPEYFFQCALAAQEAGFKIATHAIGDRAIEQVLGVYERLQSFNHLRLRHRIEHLGLPTPEQLQRMAALDIHCVTQPIFLWELGPNFRKYLSDEYLSRTYPYRSVLEAGINLVFSSDAPVVRSISPLLSIRNAVERKDCEGFSIADAESISLEEAIFAYTQAAAELRGEGHLAGSLSPGKHADFVLLDRDPWACPTETLQDIRVLETWVGGMRRM